ncbi:MAG: electron transport complex subunit RsxC [Tissierellia bacterium]|nr:electron transport complex subunit RsxC [Tissierellia bacterium]
MALEHLSFKGGYHVTDYKELSNQAALEQGPKPELVRISLHQHIGAPCEPLVKRKDEVKVGQKIGDSKATISAPIHSSVSGVVTKIEEVPNNQGGVSKTVIIESDGKFEKCFETKNNDYTQMTPEQIIELVREAGIVGLGGAGFPASVKLTKRRPDQVIDTMIINGAECEPYLTSDQMAMENFPEMVFKGLDIAMRAMGAKKGYIAVEDNKPKAIEALKAFESKYENIEIASLKTKYPQGDMRRLIVAITGKKLPKSTSATNEGIQVFNASTAIGIYQAVVEEKPLYEKIVTVTGNALKKPKNLMVPIGTSVEELISYCGGFKEEPGKVVIGGPMMGSSQFTLDIPTVKTTGGIICMTKEEAKPPIVSPCIKCGKCVDVCPVNLMPLYIQQRALLDHFEEANKLGIMDCIECGTCSYICPSNRPLVEAIIYGKNQIMAQELSR